MSPVIVKYFLMAKPPPVEKHNSKQFLPWTFQAPHCSESIAVLAGPVGTQVGRLVLDCFPFFVFRLFIDSAAGVAGLLRCLSDASRDSSLMHLPVICGLRVYNTRGALCWWVLE